MEDLDVEQGVSRENSLLCYGAATREQNSHVKRDHRLNDKDIH